MMKIRLLALSAFAVLIVLFIVGCSTANLYAPPAIQPKLEDASVNPVSGIWSDTFTYSVNCTFSKSVDITLEVYDLSLRDWKEPKIKCTRTYTDIRQRQNLTWSDMTICSGECDGTSKYRFKYDGCVLKHENGTEMIHYGPEINDSSGLVRPPSKEFKDATIDPTSGLWDDPFEYSVSVNLSWKSNITLKVFDIGSGTWKPGRTYAYTNKSKWERLTWPNEKLFSNSTGMAKYKFVDEVHKHESDIYSGPFLNVPNGPTPPPTPPPSVMFRNESVEPAYGYYNTPFTYSVEVKSNKEEEIHLEIFNISSSKWEEPGEPKDYTKKGTRHPLIWSNISNIASKNCKGGHSSFRFFFIESNDKHESDTIDYPIIYPIIYPTDEEIFKNATVDPHAGYNDTAFTYSVEANTSGEVYLLVYDISIDKWQKEINGTNTSDNRWEWKNISFSTACEGVASYKFVAGTHESGIFYGPTLKKSTSGGGGGGGGGYYEPWISYKNAAVDPNWAVIGVRERKTFNYSVEVDKDDPLILEVYNLSSTVWVEKGKGEKSKLEREKGKWKHEWTVTLTLDCNWVGRGKYRFYPENQGKYASQVYYGPDYKLPEGSTNIWKEDIPASNTHLAVPTIATNVEPKEGMWFKKFTYTANVKHPNKAKMMVVLFVYNLTL